MIYLPHILVVDDDLDICEVVRDLLENNGWRVSMATQGAVMRRVVAAETVDLVILDMLMPGESGASLAQHARECGLPVLLMTGDPGHRAAVEDSGFPFLLKPFRGVDLLALVSELLRRSDNHARC